MSENTIFVKKYDADMTLFPFNEQEIWRYSGYLGLADSVDVQLRDLLVQVVDELKNAFSYKVCYRRMEITWENGMPKLPFSSDSKNLAKCLEGSSELILFAATIGLDIDRHIAKYQRFAPTKALLMQAYGAERVEVLCDVFCKQIKEQVEEEGLSCTARYSPGYGDLPLDTQKDVFRLLDCNRQIGIALNDSLLMTPSKSVTAMFGLGSCVGPQREHKCEACSKVDCEYRKTV